MSRTSAPKPSKRILLPGTVSVSQKSISLTVLVDFIDSDFVFQHNIPTLPLPKPKAVYTLDGRLLSQVTHCTVPLSLCLSGNHHEHISLFLIPSPNNPLVLGLTWLKLHKTHIDWSTSTIVNWSLFCHSHCLRSAVPDITPTAPEPPKPVDLSSIPSEYHSLQAFF